MNSETKMTPSRVLGDSLFHNQRCKRFRGLKGNFDPSGPIVFLKLREMGCDLHSAVTFCGKNICRYDSTRVFDGPPNFRKLRLKKNSSGQQLSHVFLQFSIIINGPSFFEIFLMKGWANGIPAYDFGKKFVGNLKELQHEADSDEGDAVKNLQESEKRVKDSYKKRLSDLQKYYTELNEEFKIKDTDNNKIQSNLQKIREKLGFEDLNLNQRNSSKDFIDSQTSGSPIRPPSLIFSDGIREIEKESSTGFKGPSTKINRHLYSKEIRKSAYDLSPPRKSPSNALLESTRKNRAVTMLFGAKENSKQRKAAILFKKKETIDQKLKETRIKTSPDEGLREKAKGQVSPDVKNIGKVVEYLNTMASDDGFSPRNFASQQHQKKLVSEAKKAQLEMFVGKRSEEETRKIQMRVPAHARGGLQIKQAEGDSEMRQTMAKAKASSEEFNRMSYLISIEEQKKIMEMAKRFNIFGARAMSDPEVLLKNNSNNNFFENNSELEKIVKDFYFRKAPEEVPQERTRLNTAGSSTNSGREKLIKLIKEKEEVQQKSLKREKTTKSKNNNSLFIFKTALSSFEKPTKLNLFKTPRSSLKTVTSEGSLNLTLQKRKKLSPNGRISTCS